MKGSADLVG